jgi:glycosyltransferase involved in cell wall biosynthesis
VGRVSLQKNLDHVLSALSKLPRPVQLDVYGGSDRLGVPQLGKRGGSGIPGLRRAARALGVERRVRLHGHVDPARLDSILGVQKPVFISLSTHLDENFGVAAFKALQLGCPAVLSAWGGHLELKRMFPDRVWLVPVTFSAGRFEVSSDEVVSAVTQALSAPRQPVSAASVGEQARRTALELLSRAIQRGGSGDALQTTGAFRSVAARWHREYGKPDRPLFWFGSVFSSRHHRVFADWRTRSFSS